MAVEEVGEQGAGEAAAPVVWVHRNVHQVQLTGHGPAHGPAHGAAARVRHQHRGPLARQLRLRARQGRPGGRRQRGGWAAVGRGAMGAAAPRREAAAQRCSSPPGSGSARLDLALAPAGALRRERLQLHQGGQVGRLRQAHGSGSSGGSSGGPSPSRAKVLLLP